MNESGMYDMLEFFGSIPGKLLREYGWGPKKVPDEDRNYVVQIWVIGRYAIKVQLSPSPRKRPPFYISSFEKVPGTMVGNAIPDIIGDMQDVCNATLRSLVNNLSMASGPQAVINDQILAPEEDGELFPWKVWKVSFDPTSHSTAREPVTFFQPNSNAQELLGVYEKVTQITDELSAIPRYITGSERMGGAGRTASGLAMLMGNASKILQTVAGNVDIDVFQPMLSALYDIIMLTDKAGVLRGDENILVQGVAVAIQKETERQRQIEFLQATANPIDLQITGMTGRAALLRSIAGELGMEGETVVPPAAVIEAREKAQQLAAQAQANAPPDPNAEAAAQAQGGQRGGENTGPRAIQGPRTDLSARRPAA